jgi:hypothetical protein
LLSSIVLYASSSPVIFLLFVFYVFLLSFHSLLSNSCALCINITTGLC